MNLFTFLFRNSWQKMLLAVVTCMIAGLSSTGLIALINQALSGDSALSLSVIGYLFFGLCVLQAISRQCSSMAMLDLSQSAVYQLRVDLSRKMICTPQKNLENLGKAKLLAILTQDIVTLLQANQELVYAFNNFVIIIACLCYLMWLSWQLLLAFLVFLLIGVAVSSVAERAPIKQMMNVRGRMDVMIGHFRNLIDGSKELQLNSKRAKNFIEQILAGEALDIKKSLIKAATGYAAVLNVSALVYFFAIGILLFIIPHWIDMPSSVRSSMTITLLYMSDPINELLRKLPIIRQANIAVEKIRQIDEKLMPMETLPLNKGLFEKDRFTQLELKGICHHYPSDNADHPFMLGPIDLTIGREEIVFIVGGNGSGKTTLAMLLLGLYVPEAGTIRLNDHDITDQNRANYREHFSAVFADFHLFEHLLEDEDLSITNLAEKYIQSLGLSQKVKIVDNQFSTVNLSTGQRKRLALVSAYLEDRQLYLFDEWAADQDPTFKRVFYTELLPDLKARGKTVIVITHDDSYFSCADRVVKISEGRIQSVTYPSLSEKSSKETEKSEA